MRITGKAEVIDALRREVHASEAQPQSGFKFGFGFALGVITLILLFTVIPFVLSAIMSAIWHLATVGFDIPFRSSNGEFLMWLFAGYTIVGFGVFVWYKARKA